MSEDLNNMPGIIWLLGCNQEKLLQICFPNDEVAEVPWEVL